MLEQEEAEPAKATAAAAKPEQVESKETQVGKATGTRRRTTKKKEADAGT
jgi:hypothetical protein